MQYWQHSMSLSQCPTSGLSNADSGAADLQLAAACPTKKTLQRMPVRWTYDPSLTLQRMPMTQILNRVKYVNEARVGQKLTVVHEWEDGHSSSGNADPALADNRQEFEYRYVNC